MNKLVILLLCISISGCAIIPVRHFSNSRDSTDAVNINIQNQTGNINADSTTPIITGKSVESFLRYEENINYGYWIDISLTGELQLNKMTTIRSGLSLGELEYSTDLKAFMSVQTSPLKKVPVDFSLYWIYNGLSGLDVHENSILPTITYNWSRRGVSLGYNSRFTSFWGEDSILENALVYTYYSDFYKGNKLQFRFVFGNYDEYKVNPVTSFTYHLIANVSLNEHLLLTGGMELLQSGGFNFVESLYGISIKTGLRYKW